MRRTNDFSFNRFVLGLFAVALLTTSAALFAISYIGSLSIADRELERFARKEGMLAKRLLTQARGRLRTRPHARRVGPARSPGCAPGHDK